MQPCKKQQAEKTNYRSGSWEKMGDTPPNTEERARRNIDALLNAVADIFVRFMNDVPFQKTVTAWMASEAYRKLRGKPM